MISPGTAYDDPRLGKDPQPDHMSDFVTTSDDNGGVHINSGIPNRAFALAARAIGGQAWTAAGQIWFDVLTGADITARTDFATFARLTVAAAAARFGSDSAQHDAVRDGWVTVGVQLDAQVDAAPSEPPAGADAELLLRRTGGLAGLVKERRTTLDELPAKDAKRWSKLLTSDTLQSLSGGNPAVDGFCYRVACEALSVDVTVPEHQLSESQRNLFKRTLHQGDQ